MIVVNCEQKSDEWYAARLGIPTASNFGRILTPTGQVSKQAEGYIHELLAEYLTGRAIEGYSSEWTERGQTLEAEARAYYELQTDRVIQTVGFVYRDESRLAGCSPDGLFEDLGIEIKVPKASTHVRYLLRGDVPLIYLPQVQGAMWITGAQSWEWLSYHPDLDPVIVRVKRDDKYIDKLDAVMGTFVKELVARRNELLKRGLKPSEYRSKTVEPSEDTE